MKIFVNDINKIQWTIIEIIQKNIIINIVDWPESVALICSFERFKFGLNWIKINCSPTSKTGLKTISSTQIDKTKHFNRKIAQSWKGESKQMKKYA